MAALQLSRSNDPLLNVKLGGNNFRVFNLLAKIVSVDGFLVVFVSVHNKQVELTLADFKVNQFNDLAEVRVSDESA